ncbi:MAG: hypothetical protein RIE74_11055 [Pseudomonadales bacterium]
MSIVEGSGPDDYKRMAIEAIQNLPDDRAMGYLNHLLEDVGSTSRIQQSIEFVAEVLLHGPDGDQGHVCHAMTADALEGMGWILQSCHRALELHDELARAMWLDRPKMRAVE